MIGNGGAPEPIRVRLADGAATIVAKLPEGGEPETESMVAAVVPKAGTPGTFMVLPLEPSIQKPAGGFSGQMNGSPFFMGLAPGDYSVYAWRSTQQIEYRNPAVIAGMSSYAVSISVGNGETKEVAVKLIPKADN